MYRPIRPVRRAASRGSVGRCGDGAARNGCQGPHEDTTAPWGLRQCPFGAHLAAKSTCKRYSTPVNPFGCRLIQSARSDGDLLDALTEYLSTQHLVNPSWLKVALTTLDCRESAAGDLPLHVDRLEQLPNLVGPIENAPLDTQYRFSPRQRGRWSGCAGTRAPRPFEDSATPGFGAFL